jgi:hypothetical protein
MRVGKEDAIARSSTKTFEIRGHRVTGETLWEAVTKEVRNRESLAYVIMEENFLAHEDYYREQAVSWLMDNGEEVNEKSVDQQMSNDFNFECELFFCHDLLPASGGKSDEDVMSGLGISLSEIEVIEVGCGHCGYEVPWDGLVCGYCKDVYCDDCDDGAGQECRCGHRADSIEIMEDSLCTETDEAGPVAET